MKMEILKSQYLQRTILAILIPAAVIYFAALATSRGMTVPSEEIYTALEGRAELIMDFDEARSDILILNGEKGYFAVNEGGIWKVVNRNGELLANTELGSVFSQKAGGYFLTTNGIRTCLVNVNTLTLQFYEGEGEELHPGGRYFVEHEDGTGCVIRTEDCKVVYRSKGQLTWPQKEDYVIETAKDGRKRIVNLEIGLPEFEAEIDQEIADGTEDFWLIQDGSCFFVLDAKYQVAAGGRLFREARLGDGLVIGTVIEDADYTDLKEYSEDGIFVEPDWCVINRSGEEVYRVNPINTRYLGSVGNMLVTRHTQSGSYTYRIIGQNGPEEEVTTEFYCYLSEDAYMPAYRTTFSRQSPMSPSKEPDPELSSAYSWAYVDTDLNPVTEFVFQKASRAEAGYAVVYNAEGQAALIDLTQGGKTR